MRLRKSGDKLSNLYETTCNLKYQLSQHVLRVVALHLHHLVTRGSPTWLSIEAL